LTRKLSAARSAEDRVTLLHQQVKLAGKAFDEKVDSLDVKKLESIAQMRFVLTQGAILMYQMEIDKDLEVLHISKKLEQFFVAVHRVCETAKSDLPRFDLCMFITS
jgi:hypothetical protein